MNQQTLRQETKEYEPGAWRTNENTLGREAREEHLFSHLRQFDAAELDSTHRNPRDQSRLIELLGLINYRILTGNRVYIQVGGIVYNTLFGLYWRSVFTGVEHYLLRCQEVSGGIWTEGSIAVDMIDLPIAFTSDGWSAQGHSLMFILNRD